jgi:hypothetical protein
VGDQNDYNNPEAMSNFIYIGFHGSIKLPDEKMLKSELGRYGQIKQIYFKQSNFLVNGQRSFIFAEMADTE